MSKINSLVSVIIPIYNAEKYINECIDSILKQTYNNLQIILVNDGSTDNTGQILEYFSHQDIRILIVNQENKGCSAAKNKGLEFAKGEFVQYLDADDILSKDKIEIQVKTLNENLNSIAVCKTVIFQYNLDDAGEEIDTDLISKEGSGIEFLLRLWGSEGKIGMVQPNAYLVPINIINIIGKWDESLSPSPDEDGEYFARALIASNKVIFTDGINYYRKLANESSLSKSFSLNHAKGLFNTIKKKFEPLISFKGNDIFKYYAFQLTSCAYQYGNQFPEIYELVEKEFKLYNIKKYKLINNTVFAKTANVFGFRNAMKLKNLFNSIK